MSGSLVRWDQLVEEPGGPSARDALAELTVAVVHAAVVIPVHEARRAVTWSVPTAVVDGTVATGRVVRLPDGRLAVPMR